MITLIINIKELIQVRDASILKVSGSEMAVLPTIKNAFLIIEDDLIADFGMMKNLPTINADKRIDAMGKMILPTWCDSHTHIVYAGNRIQEFVDRINGLSYEEIANRGGPWLLGKELSVCDLYVAACARWAMLYPVPHLLEWNAITKADFLTWPHLLLLLQSLEQRPRIREAILKEDIAQSNQNEFSDPSMPQPKTGSVLG
mgnify:CR=1 FL=1